MTAETIALQGRAFAEAQMLSTCVITRSVVGDLDPTTGDYSQTTSTTYQGPCLVKFAFSRYTPIYAEGQELASQEAILKLPLDTSGDVKTDDIAEITSSTDNETLVGLKLRIAGVHAQTIATSRRLPVQVIS